MGYDVGQRETFATALHTQTDHGERGDEGKRRDGRRLVTSVLTPSQPRTIT